MGVLATIAERLGVAEKPTTLRTVTVKVKMDCEGCERKVRNALLSMRGSSSPTLSTPFLQSELLLPSYSLSQFY